MPGLTSAPRIETDRLILRSFRRDDFESCFALWSDPVVVRHIGNVPSTPEDVWQRLARNLGHWALTGFGFWAIEHKETGQHIGDCGLFEGMRGFGARFDEGLEAGWGLIPSTHGQGLAQEAVTAAISWLGWQRTGRPVVCMIEPDNAPSIRLAEKLGFVVFDRKPYRNGEMLLLERA